ncbi:30S ribosomal protein S3 [Candidatus Micrarchaeota archaeon]|nr:30S ribosomal protein S3 [Candidatus Micrarchaeota archaeon]MBD3418273.1 30S ribosomal protein S3 [Candidatus Micrarchaeota archaeon]
MMAIEGKFIDNPIERYKVMKFLENELDRAGVANIEIQRTPVVTRIAIEVLNPGRVIGKKGKTINALTETLRKKFKLDNPQISVVEVKNPTLEPRLVAKKASKYIEMGKKVRAVLHFLLKDIMRNGALGAEIVASGKIGAKGARSKSLRVADGYIPKAGEPARLVDEAHVSANTKSGIIGVLVRIAPPGTVFPDKPENSTVESRLRQDERYVKRERDYGGRREGGYNRDRGRPPRREEKKPGQPVERVQGPPKDAKAGAPKPEAKKEATPAKEENPAENKEAK